MGDLSPFRSKKPDMSAFDAQEKRITAQEKKLAAEQKATAAAEAKKRKSQLQARQGQRGSRSLLSGLETGVLPEEQKRETLG